MPQIFWAMHAQAGGYLAEPQRLNQMDFLIGLAGLEADFTGIRSFRFNNWSILGLADTKSCVQKLVDWSV